MPYNESVNIVKTPRGELARLFLYLGATSLGGPAAHIARMNEEVVVRRQWITATEFLDMLAAANLIPGPNSTELALHIGFRRAGIPGLLIAGLCFIAPAAVLVTFLAWLYVEYGVLPRMEHALYFTKPVVIAIILKAALDLARATIKSTFLAVLAILAAIANASGVHELAVLFLGGGMAMALLSAKRTRLALLVLPAVAAPMGVQSWSVFGYFLKIGAVLYGSGYVLVAFLQADLVNRLGWITERQLLDAVTVGQITPGPLFTTATFIGYLMMGVWGAFLATVGIFLPAFVLVAVTQPLVRRARSISWMAALLDGINAAAVALIFVVAWQLAQSAVIDLLTLGIAGGALALLYAGAPSIFLVGLTLVLGLLV